MYILLMARNGSSQRKHPNTPWKSWSVFVFLNGDSLSVSDFSWVVAKIGFGLAVEPIFRDIRFLYRIYSLASKKAPITQNVPKHEKSFTKVQTMSAFNLLSKWWPKESSAKIPPSPLGQKTHQPIWACRHHLQSFLVSNLETSDFFWLLGMEAWLC